MRDERSVRAPCFKAELRPGSAGSGSDSTPRAAISDATAGSDVIVTTRRTPGVAIAALTVSRASASASAACETGSPPVALVSLVLALSRVLTGTTRSTSSRTSP